jgi:hypothetical protein
VSRENSYVFDPEEGEIIREPLGDGEGWWAGAPGVYYDACHRRFYLAYRYRRPRGVHPDRGGEFNLAVSEDGIHFKDIWRLTKDEIGSPSLERGCLRQMPGGKWRLWISYVDPKDQRWRIDSMDADAPDRFEVSKRRPALLAADIGEEGVKDPWVFRDAGAYWMMTSYAQRAPEAESASDEALHHHADAYDTGLILSHSGLAVSADGNSWNWLGPVLEARNPGVDWDGYSARIACILRSGTGFMAYYDGAIGVKDHYDERTSMAVGFDLRNWTRLSPGEPILSSPHGTGCCRYFDAIETENRRYVYYEYARPDGSHELRTYIRVI